MPSSIHTSVNRLLESSSEPNSTETSTSLQCQRIIQPNSAILTAIKADSSVPSN
ncbi:hypothetical protein OnM2_053034, partial [Erysiphe neolycopersici]